MNDEQGLHRKRLISYGGLLKEVHKKLNLDDAENGDLIHANDEEKADGKRLFDCCNVELGTEIYFIKG